MNPISMSATELAGAIQSKTFSSRAVVDAYLDRIEAHDSTIGAYVTVDAEGARAAADAIDAKLAAGEPVGSLAGVPVALKDNLCLPGLPTSCSSAVLKTYNAPYTAHVVERLRDAGAVFLGKTNLDEFAMGSSTENSSIKPTANPWDTTRIPGGSSGGSAAAIAAGLAPLALGSDTGGSIRQPASLCGCVGMKPTYGLVSRWGLVAFGSSLDQIGPLARTVKDAATLLNVIAGPDERDSTCHNAPAPDFTATLGDGVKGMKIGLPKEYFDVEGLSDEVRDATMKAVDLLKAEGAEIVEVSLPMLEYAVPAYYIICTAEASSNLARYDGVHYGHRTENADNIIDLFSRSRAEGFGQEVKRRIMLGTYVLSAGYYDAYYLRALRVRTKIAEDFATAFETVDAIAGPASPTTAFKIGEKSDDPLAMYLSDIYTISINLAALPGISVPCGFGAGNLPIGLQLVGGRFEDAKLLQIAAAYERASGIDARLAPLG